MGADLKIKAHHATSPASGILDDRSGSIAVGATSQVMMPANTERCYWSVQNHSDSDDLWIKEGGAAVVGQPSTRIGPQETYTPSFIDRREIQIICVTGGVEFTCKEG